MYLLLQIYILFNYFCNVFAHPTYCFLQFILLLSYSSAAFFFHYIKFTSKTTYSRHIYRNTDDAELQSKFYHWWQAADMDPSGRAALAGVSVYCKFWSRRVSMRTQWLIHFCFWWQLDNRNLTVIFITWMVSFPRGTTATSQIQF